MKNFYRKKSGFIKVGIIKNYWKKIYKMYNLSGKKSPPEAFKCV